MKPYHHILIALCTFGSLFLWCCWPILSHYVVTRRRRMPEPVKPFVFDMDRAWADLMLEKHGDPGITKLGPDNWKPHLILLAPEHSESLWNVEPHDELDANPWAELEELRRAEQIEEMQREAFFVEQALEQQAIDQAIQRCIDSGEDPWSDVPDVIASDCAVAGEQPIVAHRYPSGVSAQQPAGLPYHRPTCNCIHCKP